MLAKKPMTAASRCASCLLRSAAARPTSALYQCHLLDEPLLVVFEAFTLCQGFRLARPSRQSAHRPRSASSAHSSVERLHLQRAKPLDRTGALACMRAHEASIEGQLARGRQQGNRLPILQHCQGFTVSAALRQSPCPRRRSASVSHNGIPAARSLTFHS